MSTTNPTEVPIWSYVVRLSDPEPEFYGPFPTYIIASKWAKAHQTENIYADVLSVQTPRQY